MQWKYTSSRIPRFNRAVSKHNPYLYYPLRLLPILGYSDIPLVGGSRLSLLTIILSHLLLTARDEFPVTNPIKHGPGRNHFVRRLHYATGEIRSYTLYFPMHRTLCSPVDGPRFKFVFPVLGLDEWFSSSDLQVSVNLAWALPGFPIGQCAGQTHTLVHV